jgi:hypothetical protein
MVETMREPAVADADVTAILTENGWHPIVAGSLQTRDVEPGDRAGFTLLLPGGLRLSGPRTSLLDVRGGV